MGNAFCCAKQSEDDLRKKLIIGSLGMDTNVDDSTICDDVYTWASTHTNATRMNQMISGAAIACTRDN